MRLPRPSRADAGSRCLVILPGALETGRGKGWLLPRTLMFPVYELIGYTTQT